MPEPTATAARLLATPEAFRAWLMGKPAGAIVGRTCEERDCPLAHFVADVTGGVCVIRRSTYTWWHPDNPSASLVDAYLRTWMQLFTSDLDTKLGRNRRQSRKVTARLALSALDRATVTGEAQA